MVPLSRSYSRNTGSRHLREIATFLCITRLTKVSLSGEALPLPPPPTGEGEKLLSVIGNNKAKWGKLAKTQPVKFNTVVAGTVPQTACHVVQSYLVQRR